VAEAEWGVAIPPPNVQAVTPTDGRPVPPQGSTPAVIDLTVDDPSSDKGKQKADVEMVNASDRLETSIMSEDDMAEVSARWPNFMGLVLARAGRSSRTGVGRPSSSGTRLTPTPSPSSPLMTRMKCNTRSTSRDSVSTLCSPYGWLRTPWCSGWF
jgi:hypothetical protein